MRLTVTATLAVLMLLVPSGVASGSIAPTCHLRNLTISLGRYDAAAGNIGQTIRLRNVGTTTCSLDGYARILRLDRHRDGVETREVHGRSMIYADPGPGLVVLAPEKYASFGVGWGDTGPDCSRSTYFRVTPPHSDGHKSIWTGKVYVCSGGRVDVSAVQKGREPKRNY